MRYAILIERKQTKARKEEVEIKRGVCYLLFRRLVLNPFVKQQMQARERPATPTYKYNKIRIPAIALAYTGNDFEHAVIVYRQQYRT